MSISDKILTIHNKYIAISKRLWYMKGNPKAYKVIEKQNGLFLSVVS